MTNKNNRVMKFLNFWEGLFIYVLLSHFSISFKIVYSQGFCHLGNITSEITNDMELNCVNEPIVFTIVDVSQVSDWNMAVNQTNNLDTVFIRNTLESMIDSLSCIDQNSYIESSYYKYQEEFLYFRSDEGHQVLGNFESTIETIIHDKIIRLQSDLKKVMSCEFDELDKRIFLLELFHFKYSKLFQKFWFMCPTFEISGDLSMYCQSVVQIIGDSFDPLFDDRYYTQFIESRMQSPWAWHYLTREEMIELRTALNGYKESIESGILKKALEDAIVYNYLFLF